MKQKSNSIREDQEGPLLTSKREQQNYKPDRFRVCNLVLFIMISACSDLSFYGFSLVATQIEQLFQISNSTNYWYSSAYLISSILLSIPASFLISSYSVKTGLAVGVTFCIIGVWLRVGVQSSFYFAFAGQYLVGAAYPFFRNTVTQISAHWFSPSKRALSTTLFCVTNAISSNLSLYLPTLAINLDTIPQDQENYYRRRVTNFFLIYAIGMTVLGVTALLFYRNAPSIPISLSSEVIRIKPRDSFKAFFSNSSAVLFVLNDSFQVAAVTCYGMIMQSGFQNYGVSTSKLKLYVLISLPLFAIVAPPVSILAGKMAKYKVFLIGLNISSLIALVILLMLINLHSSFLFGLCFDITFLSMCISISLAYQAVAEVAYPISQSFGAGVLMISIKIISFLFLQACSLLINRNLPIQTLGLIGILQLASVLVLFPIKGGKYSQTRKLETQKSR